MAEINLHVNPNEWQSQSVRWGNKLHSLCSYMASFPPRVPHYFIDRFSNKGDIVLDPFCGKGTTVAEACYMGRYGVGNDLNPIAYNLTRAKIFIPKRSSVNKRLSQLKKNFSKQEINNIPDKIKMLYSERVLHQLVYLKNTLNPNNSKVDNFILALILGGMHGDSNRPNYVSISMPNTFSMSPNYIKNYIKKHNLKPPKHDIFQVIKYRMERYLSQVPPTTEGKVFFDDVRNLSKNIKKNSVDLVFTSPPYLKVIKYGKMNWIRLWMLGADPKDIDQKLDTKHGVLDYMEFMKITLNEISNVLKEDGLCFIVVGQVNGERGRGKGKNMRLGNQIRFRLQNKTDLEFIEVIDDKYNKYLRVQKNVSRIWGKTKGKATRYDQIIALCKDPDIISKKTYKEHIDW